MTVDNALENGLIDFVGECLPFSVIFLTVALSTCPRSHMKEDRSGSTSQNGRANIRIHNRGFSQIR